MNRLLGRTPFSAALLLLCFICPGVAVAADSASDSEKGIARYREMLADPFSNPGFLNVDRGEKLWKTARGKNNVSLEKCDLGEGPGKLEGAFAKLPRYFKDADRVMDLEQRMLWCMDKIQGLDTKDVIANRFGKGAGKTSDMEDLTAFVSNKSSGMKFQPQTSHPKEKEALEIGHKLFYRRSATMDFSCATCHSTPGKRIRLQSLPNLAEPGKDAQVAMGTYPAYQVSNGNVRTMQNRLTTCYTQMRMPAPAYTSDGLTALTLYLVKMAEGGEINVPSLKR